MPELPEVEAAMHVLRTRAVGRTIARARVLHPALRRRLAPAQLRALAGARIGRAERRGKHQLLHLDDGRVIHAHFRMNGDWELTDVGAPLPRFARAVLDFDDGSSLVFVDSRALGTIDLHPAGAELDLGLGPDAADPLWTAEQLAASLAGKRGPIKPTLLDQRLVAGLGNIYAAESLWRARISPRAVAGTLSRRQVTALRNAIAEVILRATGSRYTDDDTVELAVYDREGLPCRRCRTPIARIVQAGRSTYFCPRCQPDPDAASAGQTVGKSRSKATASASAKSESGSPKSGVSKSSRSKSGESSSRTSKSRTSKSGTAKSRRSTPSTVRGGAKRSR